MPQYIKIFHHIKDGTKSIQFNLETRGDESSSPTHQTVHYTSNGYVAYLP
jgi:hypothetical protein